MARVVLLTTGLFLVGVGAFMVLVPAPFDRLLRAARARGRALAGKVLRLLGLRRARAVTGSISSALGTDLAMRVSGIVKISGDSPVDVQLKALRTQAFEMQQRLATVERELEDHPGRWARDIDGLRVELRAWVNSELDRALGAYLRLRVAGTFVALAGNALLAVASFI